MGNSLQWLIVFSVLQISASAQFPLFRKTIDINASSNAVMTVVDYQANQKLLVGLSYVGSYGTVYVQLVDTQGTILWDKAIGDSVHQFQARGGLYTGDNDFLIWGLIYPGTSGNNDSSFIAKITTSGSIDWIEKIKRKVVDITRHVNGDYLILCQNTTMSQAIIIRSDTSLAISKEKMYFITGGAVPQNISAIPGGYIVPATLRTSGGSPSDFDLALFKVDTALNLTWCKSYTSTVYSFNSGQAKLDNGQLYLVCSATIKAGSPGLDSSEIIFMNADTSGSLNWNYVYHAVLSDMLPFFKADPSGGFMISCVHGLNPSLYVTGLAIYKISSNGILNWISVSNNQVSSGWNAVALPLQRGYLGFFSYADGISPTDIMMSRLDEYGNAGCMDTSVTFSQSSLILTGLAQTAIDSLLANQVFSFNIIREYPGGNWNTLCTSLAGVNELPASNPVSVYPNPASEKINISIAEGFNLNKPELTIYNLSGSMVYRKTITQRHEEISIRNFQAGIYLCRITNAGGENASLRFIVTEK